MLGKVLPLSEEQGPSSSGTFHGLFKVDLEFSFLTSGLFQTWNSNKPGFEKLNSRSELELIKKTVIN